MKKIVGIIPKRTVVMYQCDKCKTKYRSSSRARKCELMPVEKKLFRVGDLVSWRELRTCVLGKNYRLRGKVVKILGPGLPDEDYNIKWLQGKLRDLHVFRYEVDWKCPFCRESQSGLFYGMELITLAGRGIKK